MLEILVCVETMVAMALIIPAASMFTINVQSMRIVDSKTLKTQQHEIEVNSPTPPQAFTTNSTWTKYTSVLHNGEMRQQEYLKKVGAGRVHRYLFSVVRNGPAPTWSSDQGCRFAHGTKCKGVCKQLHHSYRTTPPDAEPFLGHVRQPVRYFSGVLAVPRAATGAPYVAHARADLSPNLTFDLSPVIKFDSALY